MPLILNLRLTYVINKKIKKCLTDNRLFAQNLVKYEDDSQGG